MLSLTLDLLTENKVASLGAAAIVTGVVMLLSASTVDTAPMDGDDDGEMQLSNVKKKKTLMTIGGSIMSIGILAQVYDQYMRFNSSSALSSSQMSPAELSKFQDRVSAAAAKLRRSIEDKSSENLPGPGLEEESAAELAARASAQISSFIQEYSS